LADAIRVAVFDEHEIFRRGIKTCLREEEGIEVADADIVADAGRIDVAVVSAACVAGMPRNIPLVVCCDGPTAGLIHRSQRISALLPRRTLRAEQLVAAVRATAVGLRVEANSAPRSDLDDRSISVLRMLALGQGTREISDELGYSERTIKSVIAALERTMGARTRAQCVAEAVRRVII
jgi:DNA-binding NarL/FixJ family response regulator